MQPGKGHRSAWLGMNLPVTRVMISFSASESRVRMAKVVRGLLNWFVRAMLVQEDANVELVEGLSEFMSGNQKRMC